MAFNQTCLQFHSDEREILSGIESDRPMAIDHARHDPFIGAVDYGHAGWGGELLSNVDDDVALNEDVGLPSLRNSGVVLGNIAGNKSVLQEITSRRRHIRAGVVRVALGNS